MSMTVLKLGLVGMDYRSMSLFKKTISTYLQGTVDIVNITAADIAVFDMDSPHAKDQWSAFKSLFPNVATIALSSKTTTANDHIHIRKPIDFYALVGIINRLVPDLKLTWNVPEHAENIAAISPNSTIKLSKKKLAQEIDESISNRDTVRPLHYNLTSIESTVNSFNPKSFLYSELRKVVFECKTEKKYRKISLWNDKFFIIDPFKNIILTDISNGVLRSVCLTDLTTLPTAIEVTAIDKNAIEFETSNRKILANRIDATLWLMALYSGRGRIPSLVDDSNFSSEHPVYLLHWPNLTRLEPIPHSQNIVSLWIKQPRSLSNLASTLGIEIEHVNNLFVACQAIGIAGRAKRPGDTLFSPTIAVTHKQRGLFASIVKKLNSLSIGKSSIALSR